MKKKIFLYFLTIISTLIVIISCGEDDPIETTGGITIKVTESGTNEPVSGAIVTLSEISQSHTTGTDGKVEIKNLEEKNYTVTVKKKGYKADSKQVTIQAGISQSISFGLQKQVPKLKVSPLEISFAKDETEKVLVIANGNDAAELSWTITSVPNWITLSKKSGIIESDSGAPQNISVVIDRSKMKDGENKATLIVKATNGEGNAEVKITATKYAPKLAADPASINFGTADVEKTITLKNITQVGTINYKLLNKPDWVTNISNSEGTITEKATKSLSIKISREGKSPATYDGAIQFSSNKNTISIEVHMIVAAAASPTVSKSNASNITHNSTKVSAEITSIGSESVSAYGFCWSTSPNPETSTTPGYTPDSNSSTEGASYNLKGTINLGNTNTPKTFEYIITNLAPNKLYYIRSYATNKIGTTYGNQIQITTLMTPTLATINYAGVGNVKATTAFFDANLTDTGNTEVTEYGFCYSKANSTPTVNDTKVVVGNTSVPLSFSKNITELQAETVYYMRAFATNNKGTAYSSDVIQFTTKEMPPVVTNGLLAYYTFNQENANDYFGNENYNGVLQGNGNNPIFNADTPAGKGKSVEFLEDKYYLLTACPDKTAEAITYAVWVKTNSTNNHYYNSGIYATANPSGSNYHLARRLILGENVSWSSGGGCFFDLNTTSLLSNSEWHHLAITTEDSKTYKLYIDGKLYKTSSCLKVLGNTSNALIGYNFKGKIDNLRIYNRALSIEEVKEIYKVKQ